MSYEIIWDQQTKDFLKKLGKKNLKEAQRIIKKINSIAENPMRYLETLVGIDAYKLRVGDYRVLIDMSRKANKLIVLFIGYRRNIYKYLKKINI